jgi:ABC-type cobalamin/Fe3+-siderophores transport system ATPase subunit
VTGLRTDGLSVWLPGRGTVLDGVDLVVPQGSVTLLAGRSGSGHSTLLKVLSGRLPPGAVTTGRVFVDGHDATGFTPTELAGAVRFVGPGPLPAVLVRDLVDGVEPALVADLGLGTVLDRSTTELDGTVRALVRIAYAVAGRGCRLLLLDQLLGSLPAQERRRAARAVAARAARGATVLWAEHLIEHALPVADAVVETLPGGERPLVAAGNWAPRTIPAPPTMALARALGLPRRDWANLDAIRSHRLVRGALPGTGSPSRWHGDTLAVVAGEEIGLPGHEVEVHYGEPLGIATAHPGDGLDLAVASRLFRRVHPDRRVLLARAATWQGTTRVGAVSRAWERRHGLPRGQIHDRTAALATLRPSAPLAQHSDGEVTALRWAMEFARTGPRLFVEPTAGLDPAGRRRWPTTSTR